MRSLVFCLMGPTAIGKTALACHLSDVLPLELISVDSSLVYRELNIGSAKPTEDELKKYPHHLINCCDLSRIYSVADFCQDVTQLCHEIHARGRYPLLVGGSMMYFNALQQGLAHLPEADLDLRKQLEAQAVQYSWAELHQELQKFDQTAYQRISVNDKQRILRAHEIYQLTGRSWTSHLAEAGQEPSFDFINLALFPDSRADLHLRIEQRLEQMLGAGLLAEVAGLPKLDHPALKSVGYRQAIAYLQGDLPEDLWFMKAVVATRQLAKRQMTWLRRFELHQAFYLPKPKIEEEIIALIQEIIDNKRIGFEK